MPGGRPVFACCDLAGGSKPPLCPIWLSCAYVGGMDWSTILVAIPQVADAADSPSEWRQVPLVRVEPFRIFAGSGFLPLFGTNQSGVAGCLAFASNPRGGAFSMQWLFVPATKVAKEIFKSCFPPGRQVGIAAT